MSDNPFKPAAGGIHHRSDIESRSAARTAEIDALIAAGAAEDVVAEKIRDAVSAHEADKAAYGTSFATGTAIVVNGSGAPRMEIVEALLGTPTGDEYAHHYGLDVGDLTSAQMIEMHGRGMSWQQIAKLATARKRRFG